MTMPTRCAPGWRPITPHTAPLIDYYAARGTLTEIDAMAEIGQVRADLAAIVGNLTTA